MTTTLKLLIVAAGYVAAFAIATLVVNLHATIADARGRDPSGGMAAFGDSLLFLAVFVVAAIPPTGVALYLLRSQATFWRVAAAGAIVIAATGVAALPAMLMPLPAGTDGLLAAWLALSPLRVLLAPMLALGFALSAVFAPSRGPRLALLGACAVEVLVFVRIALEWFGPF